MRNKILFIGTVAVIATGILIACTDTSAEKKEKRPLTEAELVKRGEYLVNAVGCDDCHSPKTPGPNGFEVIEDLRFSGYPSERALMKVDTNSIKTGWSMFGTDFTSTVGQWGMSFAANITSDATGIGNWTEQQFFKAIREGKYKGLDNSRPLLPPMPWFVYRNFSDEDIRAIYHYLKTTKPVENVVPAAIAWKDLK